MIDQKKYSEHLYMCQGKIAGFFAKSAMVRMMVCAGASGMRTQFSSRVENWVAILLKRFAPPSLLEA